MHALSLILCVDCGRGWPAPEIDAQGRCSGCALTAPPTVAEAQAAYDHAKATTDAVRAAAYALDWGAPGEDEAWQALERCKAVEAARHRDLEAATDAARDAAHAVIIAPLSPISNSSEARL